MTQQDPAVESDGHELVAVEGSLAAFDGLKKPDITPAQIISGIPILAEVLHTFGVYDLSAAQVDSLEKAATWAFVLLGADAAIRIGRSLGLRR